jgi:uncharacterized protein
MLIEVIGYIAALVLISKLPMKQAMGVSLLIIAAKSLISFTDDIGNFINNWQFLLIVTAFAIAGIFIGGWLNSKDSSEKSKKASAGFPAFGYLHH